MRLNVIRGNIKIQAKLKMSWLNPFCFKWDGICGVLNEMSSCGVFIVMIHTDYSYGVGYVVMRMKVIRMKVIRMKVTVENSVWEIVTVLA